MKSSFFFSSLSSAVAVVVLLLPLLRAHHGHHKYHKQRAYLFELWLLSDHYWFIDPLRAQQLDGLLVGNPAAKSVGWIVEKGVRRRSWTKNSLPITTSVMSTCLFCQCWLMLSLISDCMSIICKFIFMTMCCHDAALPFHFTSRGAPPLLDDFYWKRTSISRLRWEWEQLKEMNGTNRLQPNRKLCACAWGRSFAGL